MKLIISFSGRENGNCKALAEYISKTNDKIIDFKSLDIHGCSNCEYECFTNKCKYRDDDIYSLYNGMVNYDKVILIVPIYCGNPSSLYYIFNERSQNYFMHNEEKYNDIVNRLFFIGVYGSCEEAPDFLDVFEKWFDCADSKKHILGIERHKYNEKINDCIVDATGVKEIVDEFLK
ncbi:NADPH-dependent FMN reductase [Hathewaya proteolytica DSM 3090]|uniref:NADPH-dependent FMN reductase n=1 Tax=Hathewaya proteolytica DSM 3090 TaxID=1121331 RepID=A0A1M6N3A2_9CLOT|nr:NAD(P)H-dependent oxidoreductase [Hathewaya proteolytica]SHJ90152.1 NADPH-dependent FMN reductase [Hathewaya proteolytica DSM 3090]